MEIDKRDICVYKIGEEGGLTAEVSNAGACLLSLLVPDAQGRMADVVLGSGDPSAALRPGPMFGVTLGRCAGKTRAARYTYRGQTVKLSANKGCHHGHGGFRGFDKRVFALEHLEKDRVTFLYDSPDGEEGYPGKVQLHVSYRIEGMKLSIHYYAVSDADTPLNITNHIYWNLNGYDAADLSGHELCLNARWLAALDEELIPTGELVPVAGTVFDFTSFSPMLDHEGTLNPQWELLKRYDHDYIADTSCRAVAIVCDRESGRSMRVFSDLPAIHFYIQDYGENGWPGKDGNPMNGRHGFCLQPMFPQNALNIPSFPSVIQQANVPFDHTTIFQFNEGE